MKKLITTTLLFFLLAFANTGRAQVYTDTFYVASSGIDAQVFNSFMGTNYGTDTLMNVYWNFRVTRTFIDVDLTSIPTNAIVLKSEIKLYAKTVDNTVNHPMYVSRVMSSWSETGITYLNQPAVTSTSRSSITHAQTSSTGLQTMDMTALGQYAVTYPSLNHGWRISLQTESGASTNGVIYKSSENATIADRPYVIVEYVIPIELTATVHHCTSGMTDGWIEVSVDNGSGTYTSHSWYKYENEKSNLIQTDSGISGIDIDSLDDGLYLCSVTDNEGTIGYRYYLVGRYGDTTTVEFRDSSNSTRHKDFMEDAQPSFTISTSDGTRLGGDEFTIIASHGAAANTSALLKYMVDFDSLFDITAADLRLISGGHYKNASPATTDSGYISRITEKWGEPVVTWETKPAITTSQQITIDETSPAGSVARNDTIDLLNFVDVWQEYPDSNFGIDLSLKHYSQAADAYLWYYSSDRANYADRPSLVLTYSLPPRIVATYRDSLELGSIEIVAPNGELPYTFVIGYDTIPDMIDMWNFIKDSVVLDSMSFFQGKANTHRYTFADLPSEHYFIGVFDNNGDFIMHEEVLLTPETGYMDSVDMDGDSIKVAHGGTSGRATLSAVVGINQSGVFEFTYAELGDVIVGFNHQNEALADDEEDFEYSVFLDSSAQHFYVMKSDSILFDDTLMVGDIFRIAKENFVFVVYQNEYEKHRQQMTEHPTDDYKVDVVFKTAAGLLAKPLMADKLKLPKPIKAVVSNTECHLNNGHIKMGFNTSMFPGVTGGSYVIKTVPGGVTVESGSFSFPSPVTEYLPAGDYKVIYTTTGTPATSWTEYFMIVQPVLWDFQDTYYTPVSPLTITTNTMTNHAEAISQNILLEEDTIAVATFKIAPKKIYIPTGGPFTLVGFGHNDMLVIESDGDTAIRLLGHGVYPGMLTQYISVFDANNDLVITPFLVNGAGPFKISLFNDTLWTYYNGSLTEFASVEQGTPDDYRLMASSFGGTVKDAFVDFCYGSTTSEICAELDYDLNGNYYVTNNGHFCFVFNQEYNDNTITFNIYNSVNSLVATHNDFIIPAMIFGENRVVLDLTPSGHCLGKGFFYLEVINGKNEKFYLRFYNNYNGCIPVLDATSSSSQFVFE